MKKHFQETWSYYLGGFIILLIILYEANGIADLDIFIYASRDLLLGKNIYTVQYHQWFHYYYDIVFALVLTPLTYLPLYLARLLWLLVNVFFVYRIWKILISWLPLITLNKKSITLFISLSFIFMFGFLQKNFHLGQVTIFILYLALEGLYQIEKNRTMAGCLLIAMGINIKLLPLFLIPYLIYRNEWKSVLYIIGFIVILLILPALFIGYDYNHFLLVERWHLINPMNKEHIMDTAERSFHSLTTLLATLFVKDCGDAQALTLKRNIADISIQNLNIIINIVRGVFIVFALYFLKTRPFQKVTSKIQKLYEVSYLCLVVPLIFPHQQHYAFFFVFPAVCYILFYFVSLFVNQETVQHTHHFKAKKTTFIVVLSILYFLTNSHFILGQFNHIYDHYKTLTYGVLFLMILLAVCHPAKLSIQERPNNIE